MQVADRDENNMRKHITRDTILKLLSDDELVRVSAAEPATRLADGDEFLDLEEPDRGIRTAVGESSIPGGRLLTKKAVRIRTWRRILALLGASELNGMSTPN